MKGISIIICCYNSEKRLPETLKYIANQNFIYNIPVELIVVDNASTDSTTKTAIDEWSKFNSEINLCVVYERVPGLTSARICGVKNAKFEYIIFCDDDNHLNNNYLNIAFEIMESRKDVGAVGGMGIGISDVEFPEWFKDIEGPYAVGRQQDYNGYLVDRLHLWGAGLVSRKLILEKVFHDNFPLLLTDRKGVELTGGGDSEICARIQLLGWKLYYTDELQYYHFINSTRLTNEYKQKMMLGFEASGLIISKYFQFIIEGRKNIFNHLLYTGHTFLRMIIKLIFKKNKKNYMNNNLEVIAVRLRFKKLSNSEITKSIIKFIKES